MSPPSHHRRNGFVARLPKATREQINTLIEDGLTYLQIIDRLDLAKHGITEDHLGTWKAGGYLDWVHEKRLTIMMLKKHEIAQSMVAGTGKGNATGHAILQTIAANVLEFLAETDPAELRESLLSDADKFTRFVNAMVRLAEGSIKCEVHEFNHEDRLAQQAKELQPLAQPGVSEQSLQIAEDKLNLM